MTQARIQADLRRLCGLGTPAPAVAVALAPLLRETIGCEIVNFVGLSNGRLIGMSDSPPSPEVIAIYNDPERMQAFERSIAGDDLWTFLRSGQKYQNTAEMKGLVRLPVYEHVFVPQGMHHAVRVPLLVGGRPVGFASVARGPGERAFTEREANRLVALAPWLARAMNSGVESMVEGDILADEGTAILNAAGRVEFRCRDGGRLLNMLYQPSGVEVPGNTAWLDRLLARLARDCQATVHGRPANPPSWEGGSPWGRFSLRASPLAGETTEPSGLVALRISRHIPRALKVAEALVGDERLSVRQKDVCLGLAEGLSRPEIAARLGIGLSSVITHVCELYSRLGAEDREDMLRIVLNGKSGRGR